MKVEPESTKVCQEPAENQVGPWADSDPSEIEMKEIINDSEEISKPDEESEDVDDQIIS